jgi:hypothetical protein
MSAKFMRTAVLCVTIVCLAACASTVTPQRVEPGQASYDDGSQNSGVLSAVVDADGVTTGWVVTARARDRYNALVERYGASMWSPPIGRDYGVKPRSDGSFLLTNEAMAKFVAMSEKSRMSGGVN